MIREELLGKTLRVRQPSNNSLNGIQGEVVNETQHTLRIKTVRGNKTLLKAQASFEVDGYIIDGQLLAKRPHERTKSKITQWQKTIKK